MPLGRFTAGRDGRRSAAATGRPAPAGRACISMQGGAQMSGMKRLVPVLLLAALAIGPALGQTSALKGHNSDAPVDVAADRIEVQDRADRAIFSGNVVVRQGDLTLTAARLTVAYSRGGGVELRRIDATGGVTVRSPAETARGDVGIYDLERRIITLIGGVSLVQRDAR